MGSGFGRSLFCVPSMTDSLEVQVLYPARWRRRISEAQGRQPRPSRCGAVPLPRRVAGILRLLRARPLRCCVVSTSGSGGGFAPSSGGSGSAGAPALRRCAASSSTTTWRRKPLVVPVARGGSAQASLLCAAECLLRPARPRHRRGPSCRLNPSNRRGTDPYARRCGRGGAARLPPSRLAEFQRAARHTKLRRQGGKGKMTLGCVRISPGLRVGSRLGGQYRRNYRRSSCTDP